MQYSRLGFTRDYDRPLAIAGLEKRLIQAFGTYGGFGIFDDGLGLLRRSLLWHRNSTGATLERIGFPKDWKMRVPSWSWMAYNGGIRYLDLPFQEVDWFEEDLRSPWRTSGSDATWHTGDQDVNAELYAVAKDIDLDRIDGTSKKEDARIIYDTPDVAKWSNAAKSHLKCVIMGRRRNLAQTERERIHYFLLVQEALPRGSSRLDRQIWQRVGVGYALGTRISLDNGGVDIIIL